MLNEEKICAFCEALPLCYKDFPFGEEWTVFRHVGNKKIFCMLYTREGALRLNLKCDPLYADFLRQTHKSVTPGYRMNKTHWNTVAIDGAISDDEVLSMVAHSYEITRPKRGLKSK